MTSDNENRHSSHRVIVDQATLEQMIKDTSTEVLPMLIEHYLGEAKQHVILMVESATKRDLALLLHESHKLGSSALALGNVALSELSRAIELCCHNEDTHAFVLVNSLTELAEVSFAQLELIKNQGLNFS
jgi:HPt (histidine-containing phosphotransfer) domain-containing protein